MAVFFNIYCLLEHLGELRVLPLCCLGSMKEHNKNDCSIQVAIEELQQQLAERRQAESKLQGEAAKVYLLRVEI